MILIQCTTYCRMYFHFLFSPSLQRVYLFLSAYELDGTSNSNIITFWMLSRRWRSCINIQTRSSACIACVRALFSYLYFGQFTAHFKRCWFIYFGNVIKMFSDRFSFILRLSNMFIWIWCKWARTIQTWWSYVHNILFESVSVGYSRSCLHQSATKQHCVCAEHFWTLVHGHSISC